MQLRHTLQLHAMHERMMLAEQAAQPERQERQELELRHLDESHGMQLQVFDAEQAAERLNAMVGLNRVRLQQQHMTERHAVELQGLRQQQLLILAAEQVAQQHEEMEVRHAAEVSAGRPVATSTSTASGRATAAAAAAGPAVLGDQFSPHFSNFFCPFICAVLGVHHPRIPQIRALFEQALPGLWAEQVAAYVRDFAARHITRDNVHWEAGRGPTTHEPYLPQAVQEELLEPNPDLHLRQHINAARYAVFIALAPYVQL